MDTKKKQRLTADGWCVGSVQEFLGLSHAEVELIDMHIRLVDDIKRRLEDRELSQAALAKQLGTSASRLSNMLAGRQVSTDALVRALFVLGATSKDVGKVIGGGMGKSKVRKQAA
jgi:predicted XRE-type DNA-binding protein